MEGNLLNLNVKDNLINNEQPLNLKNKKKNLFNLKHGGTKKRKRRWSTKYKKSINCRRPKGFSQKQYCKYGRKKQTRRRNKKNKNKNKKK